MDPKRRRSLPARPLFSPPEELYEYQTLPDSRSIRLLRITSPHEFTRTIVAELDTVQLAEYEAHVEYVVLSYTWGPSLHEEFTSEKATNRARWKMVIVNRPRPRVHDDIDTIYHNSQPRTRLASMELSQSLSDFFTSVGPAAQTPLWIDAICIDQSSPDEVSAQVELMADIYRLAAGVIAWLGAEEDDVPALEWLINVALPSLKRKRAELCGEEHFDYSQATILGLTAESVGQPLRKLATPAIH